MNGVFKPEYRQELEDGIELCLTDVQKSTSKKDAITRLQYLLGLVREKKLNHLQEAIETRREPQSGRDRER